MVWYGMAEYVTVTDGGYLAVQLIYGMAEYVIVIDGGYLAVQLIYGPTFDILTAPSADLIEAMAFSFRNHSQMNFVNYDLVGQKLQYKSLVERR